VKPLADIRLRWFDDSTLLVEDKRELTRLLLAALGVTSETAADALETLLEARTQGRSVTSGEIKSAVENSRAKRGVKTSKGLTERNIQVWLNFYRQLGLVEKLGASKKKSRYILTGNKKPSVIFAENVRPLVDQSLDYVGRLVLKLESRYGIK